MISLLFVSEHAIDLAEFDVELYRIEQASRRRNAELGITGALASTRKHFAGVLEGDREALTGTMARITRDPRHTRITVVEDPKIDERRFARWSLCYSGPSLFAERLVAPLMAEAAPDSVTRLRHFMQGLAMANYTSPSGSTTAARLTP